MALLKVIVKHFAQRIGFGRLIENIIIYGCLAIKESTHEEAWTLVFESKSLMIVNWRNHNNFDKKIIPRNWIW